MPFINDDFMLTSLWARELYHSHAERLPIIDYHCHLDPKMIAEDYRFKDITELWLGGDHYKWRAMRACGIGEEYITGSASPWEKFSKWAEAIPQTMCNPLYHWTHLELSRVFGIDKILKPETARAIFEECNAKLAEREYSGQNLIKKFNVEVVCTTDDPADSLEWHRVIAERPFGVTVLPAWRADKALAIENPGTYKAYVERLGAAAGLEIRSYPTLLEALRKRHDFFASMGCRLSDHGMDTFYAEDYTEAEVSAIFRKVILDGKTPDSVEIAKFRSAMLYDLAVMDAEADWTQQFHVGPLRNNNTLMFNKIGPDTGYDSIGDRSVAESGNRFLDRLASEGRLARTILYCLNPKDNEVMLSMAYNFNDGTCPGKMQFGSAWWFLDNEAGMRTQLTTLASLGLIGRFVGMLTDSRSFVSYPRHEYFRRILCDYLGAEIASGKLPESEIGTIGKMVADISYFNAKDYFKFGV